MNIVIVGCGRVGAFLAGQLDKSGHAVTIVDLDRASFTHLPKGFKGTTLLGNGTDMDTLRTAGIEKADAVLTLTQGDNRNLMAAQVARQIFGVKRVIAKVNDPIRADAYRAHGISTVSRTTILGTLLEAMLMGDVEVGKVLIEKSTQAEAEMAGNLG
ncbi:MAG TPA: TrkA family potassium uptake protein [Candidatus Limnocylindria bacterium]|jgi:trk system potassium uptake protein TrkA|nr:TrkA family potassium uptake protein [Candidatus Limnocylindria bacterium]